MKHYQVDRFFSPCTTKSQEKYMIDPSMLIIWFLAVLAPVEAGMIVKPCFFLCDEQNRSQVHL